MAQTWVKWLKQLMRKVDVELAPLMCGVAGQADVTQVTQTAAANLKLKQCHNVSSGHSGVIITEIVGLIAVTCRWAWSAWTATAFVVSFFFFL